MPQPVSYNPGTPVSGSIQENSISYVVDGQNRNYRGGFGGLSWMSEVPAANNVIFIGNSVSLGRGPANIPLFYPSYNNSAANIIYAANTLPGSPRNFTTTGSAYNWAVTNNFFINNSNNPIPRINGDSLGLYIDANQPTSYPQTGNTWYDLSGIGNNCGLYNGPTWNSNGYIQFDGTDDFVGVGNTGVTKLNQNYQTLRFLIYITSLGPNGYSELYAVTNANRTGIKWETAGIGMDANGDFYNVFVNVSNAYSQWMDISCVIDRVSNIFKVYKNGTYIGQDTFTPYTANSTDITIGANRLTGNGGDYIKGNISEVSVYGKELSLSEIKQNYFQGNIVTGSLVFMVDANNLVSYPKSGTAWYQLTGSANNGTLTNGPTFKTNNGGVISLDGADDFVNFGPVNFQTSDSITLDMWVYPQSATQEAYADIFDANHSGLGFVLQQDYLTYNYYYFAYYAGSGFQVTSNILIEPYVWSHIVITKEGNQTKIYKNSQLVTNNTMTNPSLQGTNTFYLGRFVPGGRQWKGEYGNFKGYNRALTSDEVQQNYQATKDKFLGENIVTNGLVLNLDSANKDSYPGTGTTWYDLSGNGYNGTLTNGPSFLSNQNGGILDFDGVDDYTSLGSSAASLIQGKTAVTIGIFFKLDVLDTLRGLIGTLNYGCGANLGLVASGNALTFYNDTGTCYDVGISSFVETGKWIYAVGTYDGTTTRIYGIKDGTLSQSSGTSKSGATNTFTSDFIVIGNQYSSYFTNGQCGTAFVYNRVLSQAEILQNYNATKTRFGL
jgi:hypothetical protein